MIPSRADFLADRASDVNRGFVQSQDCGWTRLGLITIESAKSRFTCDSFASTIFLAVACISLVFTCRNIQNCGAINRNGVLGYMGVKRNGKQMHLVNWRIPE